MPVVQSSTDAAARRIVVVSELAAPPDRVWALWADPARLARWWGPPGAPMVVDHHDLRAEGEVRFHVQLPDRRIDAHFEVHEATPPQTLRFTFHNGVLAPAAITVTIDPQPHDHRVLLGAVGAHRAVDLVDRTSLPGCVH